MTRSHRLALAAVLFASLLSACGSSEQEHAPGAVTLLDPGREPRQELRYTIQPAAIEDFTMTMEMSMDQGDGNEIGLPRTVVAMELTPAVEGDSIRVAFRTRDIRVEDREGARAGLVPAMRAIMEGLKPMHGYWVVTPRGETGDSHFEGMESAPAQVKQAMADMQESIRSLVTELPKEPVGVGAKWRVEQFIPMLQAGILQRTDYEVLSLEGTRVELGVTLTQTLGHERSMNEGEAESGMLLQSVEGDGTGSVSLDFAHLAPVSSEMTSHSSMATAGKNTGAGIKTKTTMRMTGKGTW